MILTPSVPPINLTAKLSAGSYLNVCTCQGFVYSRQGEAYRISLDLSIYCLYFVTVLFYIQPGTAKNLFKQQI